MDNKRLSIAMIGHKRIPSREGGVEVAVNELATHIAAHKHKVVCYNRTDRKSQKIKSHKNVRICWVPTIDKGGLAAASSSFFATIKALFSDADIVHYHAEGPCAMLWIIKLFSKKRIIVTIHGLDWQREKWGKLPAAYIKLGEKIAARYADEIIVLSHSIQNYFKRTYQRETIIIPNGVRRPYKKRADLIRKKFNVQKDDYILYLGRLVPEKGIHYLIQAYQHLDTDKKLIIAGDTAELPSYSSKLLKLADGNPNIIFAGFVSGDILAELYSNAYIYCLPSNLEGMPLSLLEAMSYSNCCLTSDIPECKEVIQDYGVTFKKGSIKDLTAKLRFLLTNPNVVKNYKDNSLRFILENHNWGNITNQTIALYMESQNDHS